MQDDWRATRNLTLNLGLRWDVYPPWIEIDDRQSNFDETTGNFVIASDNARIGDVEVGRRLQTYSKGDFGPRLGFAYDVAGDGKTLVRGGYGVFWNFTPGGTSSSKAQNQPFLDSAALTPTPVSSTGVSLRLQDGLDPPTGGDPDTPRGNTRSIFDPEFRDGYAHNFNVNVQRAIGTNYLVEAAYAGSRGRHMVTKIDINQAPPVVGVSDANINRPFITLAPFMRSMSQSQAIGVIDHNALLFKFQRRFANNFSFMNSYTLGKTMDYASDNEAGITNNLDLDYNWGPADYDVRHTFTLERDLRDPMGAREVVWRMAGQRHRVLALRPAVDGHPGAGRAVDRHGQPSEHHLRRCIEQSDRRKVVRHLVLRRRRQIRRARTVIQHETRCADRANSTSTPR